MRTRKSILSAALIAALSACTQGGPVVRDASGTQVQIGGIEPGNDPAGPDNAATGSTRGPWPHPTGAQRGQ
jgi:hypothetical protein